MKKEKDKKQESFGKYTFEITVENERRIKAIMVYAGIFDLVVKCDFARTQAPDDAAPESITADGVVNFILDDALGKWVKVFRGKHGFTDDDEFIDVIGACKSPEEAYDVVKRAEARYYHGMHKGILAQIPMDSAQKPLPFGAPEAEARR